MFDVLSLPSLFIGRIIALVVSLSFHEFAHALSAYELGDSTAQRAGRLSLNPLAHLDPIGSVMMILVGFGWAKPVPVNPAYLKGDKLRSMAVTAAAGPLSNLLQAFIFALPIRFGLVDMDLSFSPGVILPTFGQILSLLVWINLILAIFNLIPLGPLDGLKVLMGLVPKEIAYRLEPLAQYGFMILVLLMLWPGGRLLSSLIVPPAENMFRLLTQVW